MSRRVIAYAMHEEEHIAATDLLTDVEDHNNAYLVGSADDAAIHQLREAGLIVEEIDLADDRDRSNRRSIAVTAGADMRPTGEGARRLADGQSGTFVMTLTGPMSEDARTQIEGTNCMVSERLGTYTWAIVATNAQASELTALGFVHQISRPGIDDWGEEPADGTGGASLSNLMLFDLVLDASRTAENVATELRAAGIEVVATATRRVRVRIPDDHPLTQDQRTVAGVVWGFAGDEAELHVDRVRTLIGVRPCLGAGGIDLDLTGAGEVLAILDTGVDVAHPDFAGRVAYCVGVDGTPDVTDRNGHGTHVAGIAVGDGSSSGGTYRGLAPAAQVVALGSADRRGSLIGLPTTVGDRFAQAYAAGARVINNSWGTRRSPAEYTADSWMVDEFVWEHPDCVVVFSAGNDASDAGTAFVADAGFTVTPPGTAKNVITVGAARSDRQSGGDAAQRWGVRYPRAVSLEPVASETVSGDAERLAAFSGRGPVTDRRIKPEVVAPGTSICSTKSSALTDAAGFSGDADRDGYIYCSGTSMAAPAVAGMCALIREWYRRQDVDPSAALVKATLINGTRWLTGSDAEHGQSEPPNHDQGFGAVDLRSTLPAAAEPGVGLRWADTWTQPARVFTKDSTAMTWTIEVRAGTPLRICLTYTDAPGRGVQNDLNLYCQPPGTVTKVLANAAAPGRHPHGLDKDNAVEIIRVRNPPGGTWQLRVVCGALTRRDRGQAYALVVTGDLDGDLTFGGY